MPISLKNKRNIIKIKKNIILYNMSKEIISFSDLKIEKNSPQ